MGLSGLAQLNVELSSRCNARCRWCGHQNPRINKALTFGDIDFELLRSIARQVPTQTVVQFHRDGEPLVYPQLGAALRLFSRHITSIVTNGILLAEKAPEIIGNCTSVCVSVASGLEHRPAQFVALNTFLAELGSRGRPQVLVKVVGDMSAEELEPYVALRLCGVRLIHRSLHSALGSRQYRNGSPPIPEHGICLDLLHHPSIDQKGNFFICNRLQPEGKGSIGNLRDSTLEQLWTGASRDAILRLHTIGRRDQVPACQGCEYWGHPAN